MGNASSYASSDDAGAVFREVANKTGAIGGHAISGVAAGLKTLDATVQAHVEGGFSHLTSKLAFYPPPASYLFRQDPRMGALQMWMLQASEATVVLSPGFSAFWIDTETGSRIPAYIFEVPRARFTILYSHSNATDIGHMNDLCRRLANVLHVNVMAYEYTGYGCSMQRPPSELETYADVRAALSFLIHTKGIPRHRIILYGQSIGSGPTIEIAAGAPQSGPFAGVVVHSGFTSCMRIVQPSLKSTPKYDIFANIDKIGHVRCPSLFIHGVADDEVPIEHAIALNRAAVDAFPPLWLDGAHHNDIEFAGRQAYIEKLLAFLIHLETTPTAPVCKIVI